MIKQLALAISLFFFCSATDLPKKPLQLRFMELKDVQSPIYVSVNSYSTKFPDESTVVKTYKIEPSGKKQVQLQMEDIAYGKYAIMIFQDANRNGILDKGFMGIPSEPFAFSNNYRPVMRAPRWSDCEFTYSSANSEVLIERLIKML